MLLENPMKCHVKYLKTELLVKHRKHKIVRNTKNFDPSYHIAREITPILRVITLSSRYSLFLYLKHRLKNKLYLSNRAQDINRRFAIRVKKSNSVNVKQAMATISIRSQLVLFGLDRRQTK